MCNFLSAIVMKNGDVLWSPHTDSHEDIITLNNLRDTKEGNFCRVKFSPEGNQYGSLDKYVHKIAQPARPSWFTEDMAEKIKQKLIGIVGRMLVSDRRELLVGGPYILVKNAHVVTAKHCRIIAMMGRSSINCTEYATEVGGMYENASIKTAQGSTVIWHMYGESRVVYLCNLAHVNHMLDKSSVCTMAGRSSIDDARASVESMIERSHILIAGGDARIGGMRGNSEIRSAVGNTIVDTMIDESKILFARDKVKVGNMADSSRIGSLEDSSNVKHLACWASIDFMHDVSAVASMGDNSTIKIMDDNSTVESMDDNSTIRLMHQGSSVGAIGGSVRILRSEHLPPQTSGL